MSFFANYSTGRNRPKKPRVTMKTSTNPQIMALKKSIANPFAATAAVKIPDGKHWLTTTLKNQSVSQIMFGPDESIGNPAQVSDFKGPMQQVMFKDQCDLLFFPGLNNMVLLGLNNALNPVQWWKPNEGGNNFGTDVFPYGDASRKLVKYAIPVPFYAMDSFKFAEQIDFDEPDVNRDIDYYIRGGSEKVSQRVDQTRIEKWRLVSSGLKLSCVNNAINNAGWYEATRITYPKDYKGWGMIPCPTGKYFSFGPPSTNAPQVTNDDRIRFEQYYDNTRLYIGGPIVFKTTTIDSLGVNPRTGQVSPPFVGPGTDMVQNPTYTSGKLRDLHKIVFKLRPTSDEHDYKDVPDTLNRAFGLLNYPWTKTGADGNNCSALVDDSFDAIHIRIHGADGTRLLMHVVSNTELVYDESSVIARTASASTISAGEAQIAKAYLSGTSANAAPSSDFTTKTVKISNMTRPTSRKSKRMPMRRKTGVRGSRNNPIVIN
jgi:hypothetical protein